MADGLAATARVITAAAAIMVFVFGVFIFDPNVFIKQIGLGLTTAVLVDATIVRMILVPATMELLGNANWWMPRWLDKLLPEVHIEGEAAVQAELATSWPPRSSRSDRLPSDQPRLTDERAVERLGGRNLEGPEATFSERRSAVLAGAPMTPVNAARAEMAQAGTGHVQRNRPPEHDSLQRCSAIIQ